jgi:8-hydroxy-5-deazaflavin:NADPH oxidoreductase
VTSSSLKPVLGIIGGTGRLGTGLARRWVKAGYPMIIGSRDPGKAQDAAAALSAAAESQQIRGAGYVETAEAADVVVLTIPFAQQADIIGMIRPALRGQLVLDTTVPLGPDKCAANHLLRTGSAAVAAQRHLAGAARVASAFHNVPARSLSEDEPIDCDVLVFADDEADRAEAMSLVEAAGLRGVSGGALANSLAAEAMTSVLISVQREYRRKICGVRFTGL